MLSERQLTNRYLPRSGRNILERRLSLGRQWSSECSIIDNVVDWRRRVESEGALGLADVVSPHSFHAHLCDQLPTVVHSEGLTFSLSDQIKTKLIIRSQTYIASWHWLCELELT